MFNNLKFDRKATQFYNEAPKKILTIEDLDEYVGRLGKCSPTAADAMRFGELSMAIDAIFTEEESKIWISTRKALLSDSDEFNAEMRTLGIDPKSERGIAFKKNIDIKLRKDAEEILARQSDPEGNGRFDTSAPGKTVVMKPIYSSPPECIVCNVTKSETVKLLMCSVCRSVWYCGVEHQKQDWISHKKICKRYPR